MSAAATGGAPLPADGIYDLFVVGGGINGCGVARDAAGRGFSVFLAEMNDLAWGTSSASTKLIHGGLRYLEQLDFRLVREALMEREVLWANAPHIIWPLRFVLPHHAGLRPAWLLRLGLFLYDHLGGRRRLPPTKVLDMRSDPAGEPLKPVFTRAFEYSDCWVNDARLVVLNARDAAERGATVRTRCRVTAARRDGGVWRIAIREAGATAEREVRARLLVNAGGPWVDRVLALTGQGGNARNVRLVQGSHIVLPRLFAHDRCYIFQNADRRIVFAIPYERDFTLIGTTDRDYDGDPGAVAIAPEEIDYLCAAGGEYFRQPIRPADIVWSYSGVRALFDDGASAAQEATRDYELRRQGGAGEPALVSIFGGKLTTYRRLAEAVMEHVEAVLGRRGPAWTHAAPLPGGDFPMEGFEVLAARFRAEHPFLDERLARRLVRLYGTRAWTLLDGARSLADLGPCLGADLYEAELRYLAAQEWAVTAEDVLWRRTKLGLHLSPDQMAAVARCMAALTGAPAEEAPARDEPPPLSAQG